MSTPAVVGVSGVELSAEDLVALRDAGDHHPDICDCLVTEFNDPPPDEDNSCQGLLDTITAVEAIVARHVNAALTEAAGKVDGWREMAHWAAAHTEDPDSAQNSHIRSMAYGRAVRIISAARRT